VRKVFFVFAFFLAMAPTASFAQIYIGIGAPPALPYYTQPYVTVPNEIWQPGYWAWGPAGYYWVPGTWVAAPSPGMLWTPGYWGFLNNGYQWNQGYWGPTVGFYGGVNYGYGYYGNGYYGGNWVGNNFRYNTAVTRVNTTIIKNVYIDKTVVVRNVNRISYNGGPHGIPVHPTPAQLVVDRAHRMPMTTVQREHDAEAQRNRNMLTTVNHGAPAHVTVPRPLSQTHRLPDFKPVTPADRAAVPHPAPHMAAPHPAPPPHQEKPH
jgi:YXWGXW repeat-containing protein